MNSREVHYLSKLKYTLGFYGVKFINQTPKEQRYMRSLSFKIQINKIDKIDGKRTKKKLKFPF
ncbi:hypothetical protein BF698P1_00060 [Bacteroides phage BF698P1]|nr:hypothetical protein BF698P1_00060 [Bacteroides phage BF698P1]